MQKNLFNLVLLYMLTVIANLAFARDSNHTQNRISIFENLYQADELKSLDLLNTWIAYKEKFNSLGTFQLSDTVQIGLDRMKFNSDKFRQNEIIDINSHLAPQSRGATSKGYGLLMRVRID